MRYNNYFNAIRRVNAPLALNKRYTNMKRKILVLLMLLAPLSCFSDEVNEKQKQHFVDFANAVLAEHAYRTRDDWGLDLEYLKFPASTDNLIFVTDKIGRKVVIAAYVPKEKENNNMMVSFYVNGSGLLEVLGIFPVSGNINELKIAPDKWLYQVISYPGDV